MSDELSQEVDLFAEGGAAPPLEVEVMPEADTESSQIATVASGPTDAFGNPLAPKGKDALAVALDRIFSQTEVSVLAGKAGVQVGTIGLVVSRSPVERIKFSVAKRELISIVSPNFVVLKTHFNEAEKIGSFLCFGGACCENETTATVRYLFPIVQYDTTQTGTPVSMNLQHKVLSVAKDTYASIMATNELEGDVSLKDFVVTCDDESYQKIKLGGAGAARWRKKPELVAEVVEFWSKNLSNITKAIAREITEAQYLQMKFKPDSSPVTSASMEDVFGK